LTSLSFPEKLSLYIMLWLWCWHGGGY